MEVEEETKEHECSSFCQSRQNIPHMQYPYVTVVNTATMWTFFGVLHVSLVFLPNLKY